MCIMASNRVQSFSGNLPYGDRLHYILIHFSVFVAAVDSLTSDNLIIYQQFLGHNRHMAVEVGVKRSFSFLQKKLKKLKSSNFNLFRFLDKP